MELRHLRYFIAVAEESHVRRAAARLNVAQSALSRQLQDLEREIGVQLFDRHARGVRLTTPGRAFLDHARQSIEAAAAGVSAARVVASVTPPVAARDGSLRIA